jgi:hypothetical protein
MRSKVIAPLGSVSLLALALGTGCPDNTPAPDAAVVASDTGGGGADTGPATDDTGSPGADAPVVDDVARCTATAAMVATACAGQADRTCEHTAGGMRCATERADVLADAYQCLLDASTGTGSCRTFSDPSGASACLEALGAATTLSSAGEALVTHILATCTDTTRAQVVSGGVIPLMALSDAAVGRLDACVMAAADCGAVSACAFTEFPDIVGCYDM